MILLWFALGVISGTIITSIVFHLRSSRGVLRIDRSDPNKDVYRFDVGKIDDLSKKKRIILRIDNDADLSQK